MIASETARNVLNFLLFQAGWFACVFYPGLIGAGIVVVFLILHFVLVSQNRMTELQFIGLGTVVGSVLDGIWFQTGILDDGTGQIMLTPQSFSTGSARRPGCRSCLRPLLVRSPTGPQASSARCSFRN